ncbi:MAG: S8 family serine peptidase [Phycisphaerae bacterium]|nr:S8 family serine peptidase [Phycisphaerae bacterium]
MRRTVALSVLAIASTALAAPPAPSFLTEPGRYAGPVDAADVIGGYRSDRLLVKLAPEARLTREKGRVRIEQAIDGSSAVIEGVVGMTRVFQTGTGDATLEARYGLDRWWSVELPQGSDVKGRIASLRAANAPIDRIEAEGIGGILATVPNDSSFGLQYGPNNTGQVINGIAGIADADLDLPEAWDLHTGTNAITVAIIDTGVSNSHPDLSPKLVSGWNTISDNTSTDDSFLISHGSHCAGIAAAASNNGIGVAGVSWGAKVMPVKVLTFIGSGVEGDVADGIKWAADHGAHVGSMSLGFPGASTVIEDAVNYATDAGMLIVAASGNTPGAVIGAPAKYPAVLAVGATDNKDLVASFTTTGPELDVSAPGVDVYSCWDVLFNANTYVYESGTSMACPHVAGLAALVWSANPELTNLEVREIIEATAEDKGAAGWDPIYGHGRVNARLAVEAALAPRCEAADLDCDGDVDAADLAVLLGAWGSTGAADLNGNGSVGAEDLAILLGAWQA